MPDLLFELYVEELPASYLDKAINSLREKIPARLEELRVKSEPGLRVTGTPRRICVHLTDVRTHQLGSIEELTGPPVSAAFKDGKPTKAAEAFAAKIGVPIDKLEQKDTPKGKYLFGVKKTEGKHTGPVLQEMLHQAITTLEFPKSMTWVPGSKLRFARPLRSIVAIFDKEVLPIEWNGIRSGRTTWGHPFLAPGAIELTSASWDEYAKALLSKKVIIDRDERRKRIHDLVKKELGRGEPNEKVVVTAANLVEWPEVMTGEFEKRFLEIPPGVIVSAIEHHLRAFPLVDASGNLMSKFAFVCNRPPHEVIRRGNERVLRARLSDAHFFYEKDQTTPLKELAEKLEGMVFQRDLGSYAEKQNRVRHVALGFVHDEASRDASWQKTQPLVDQAAAIMKADLVTEVVGEFPELQGEVGAVYAKKQGLPAEVAESIREAYLPKGEGDDLPATRTGIALALAEKADNVVAGFATGNKPTGSKDPLGVRRQVIGILRILRERKLETRLSLLLELACGSLPDAVFETRKKDPKAPLPERAKAEDKLEGEVLEFARGRLDTMARDEGHKPDLIAAVARAGFENVPDFWVRLGALERLSSSPRFKDLVQLVERTRNITKDFPGGEPSAQSLKEPAEKELYQTFEKTRREVEKLVATREYVRAGELYENAFTAPVEKFMKEVFVNDKDEAIKKNRLALLKSVHRLLAEHFADLAEVSAVRS